MKRKSIAKVVTRRLLHDKDQGNASYWLEQTPQARLEALEQIRREFHIWRYGAEPRLQRVLRIAKRK